MSPLAYITGLLAMSALLAVGAYLYRFLSGTPTAREQMLQDQIDALRTATHLGAEYWQARQQMHDEGRAARPTWRANAGRPCGPVINGEVVDGGYA